MKKKEVYKGAIYLRVKIIDWTPINKVISERVGEEVECRIGNGFIGDIEAIFDKEYEQIEVKSLVIDTECCGTLTDKRNFYASELNDGKPFTINLLRSVGFYSLNKKSENGFTVSAFPSYYFDIDIDDVKNCLTDEEKSLFDFMKGRYDYNPRIRNNEIGILNLCYFKDRQKGLLDYTKKLLIEV